MRVAPVPARHLAAAAGGKDALFCVRGQLREEACHIRRRADEAAGRRDRIEPVLAGNDEAAARWKPGTVAARERRAFDERHAGLGLAQACGVDDLAFDPDAIRLFDDRFDHEANQSESMVGIFEAGVGLDQGRRPEVGDQFLGAEERPAFGILPAGGTVADKPGAVGENLREGGFRHLTVQAVDILPDWIVEPQFALLPELHDSGRGEALRMRCDPKPVARGELFAGSEVGMSERVFGDDLAAMGDGDDAAGLLGGPHLKFDPATNVADRGLHPRFHVRDLQKCRMMTAIENVSNISAEISFDVTGQNKTGATLRLRRLNWR